MRGIVFEAPGSKVEPTTGKSDEVKTPSAPIVETGIPADIVVVTFV